MRGDDRPIALSEQAQRLAAALGFGDATPVWRHEGDRTHCVVLVAQDLRRLQLGWHPSMRQALASLDADVESEARFQLDRAELGAREDAEETERWLRSSRRHTALAAELRVALADVDRG